jgi:hypothetical protein
MCGFSMKLVDDAGTLWKRWSTRVAASQLGLVGFWAILPTEWKTAVPNAVLLIVVMVFAIAFISAQALKQPGLKSLGDGDT